MTSAGLPVDHLLAKKDHEAQLQHVAMLNEHCSWETLGSEILATSKDTSRTLAEAERWQKHHRISLESLLALLLLQRSRSV